MKGEGRFQWSIQRSIKIKALPYLIKELHRKVSKPELEEMEEDFNWQYRTPITAGVVFRQRSFMRTMNFMKNDLTILNDDYSLREGLLTRGDDSEILSLIHDRAMEYLIPFQLMVQLFHELPSETYDWEEFKASLSNDMIMKARDEFPNVFRDKDKKEAKKTHGGVYRWRMDDPSINRLVEFGRLVGVCSFVVMSHIRFVNDFKRGDNIRTIDLDGLITLLKSKRNDLDSTTIMTLDDIYNITDSRDIPVGVVEDAIISAKKEIDFYSGQTGENNSISMGGKTYYRIRFKEVNLE